jgi:adenine-specific DNA-methyltransferase
MSKPLEERSREELLEHIARIEGQKKYGLVWDVEHTSEHIDSVKPVLIEVTENRIHASDSEPEHILIEGDNYHALMALRDTHAKKVNLIYIDPPYNRGATESDFRYNDTYVDKKDEFRHSKWLSFMAKRLMVAKDLLEENGVIFVSIDDNELSQLKLLMDELFGEENYRNTIVIKRGAKNVQAQFETIDKLYSGYEYVLFYSMNPGQRFPKLMKKLEKPKPGGWNNHWRGTNRPTMRYELFGITPKTGQWRWSRERSLRAAENYQRLLNDLGQNPAQPEVDAWFSSKCEEAGEEIDLLRVSAKGKPEHYVPPSDSTLLNDVWFDIPPNSTSVLKNIFGEKVFDNPKPLELIKRICQFADKNALILDFFAGSGTTAHAVMELNAEDGGRRRVILATNNENNICVEVCHPRVKKNIEGYVNARGAKVKGFGGGLRYLKVQVDEEE